LARLYRTDFHIHTYLSDCGSPEATPKAILRAAQEARLEAIGLSDHIIAPADKVRPGKLRAQVPKEVGEMRVYVGCEADVTSPTEIAIDAEFAHTLDYVMVSASHLYEPRTNHPIRAMEVRTQAAYLISTMNLAVECGFADVVVHPFIVPVGLYDFRELVAEADPEAISRLGEKAARAGVAIEFNPRVLQRWPDAAQWLFGRLLDTGVKLAVNSDTHHPRGVGCRGQEYASEEEMRAVGVTDDVVWRIEDRVSDKVRP